MKKSLVVLALVLVMVLAACGGKSTTGGIPADAALKITGNVNSEIGWSEKDVRAMTTAQADFTNKDGETKTAAQRPSSSSPMTVSRQRWTWPKSKPARIASWASAMRAGSLW